MERLNEVSLKKIDEIVNKHAGEPGPVIVMLHEVQDELGYVPYEAMEAISKATGKSIAEVFGVVNFYAQFTTEPKGKHIIKVCNGTACHLRGSMNLTTELKRQVGIEPGQTSEDGEFSVELVNCLGSCALAPVMVVDGVYHNKLSVDKVGGIIQSYRDADGKEVPE